MPAAMTPLTLTSNKNAAHTTGVKHMQTFITLVIKVNEQVEVKQREKPHRVVGADALLG